MVFFCSCLSCDFFILKTLFSISFEKMYRKTMIHDVSRVDVTLKIFFVNL